MLTSAQMATLRAAIIASATAGPMRTAGDSYSLLQWLNGASTTTAWKTNVPNHDSDEAANYTAYDTMTQGKRDSWSIFLAFDRDFNKAKNRNWVVDVWGNATANSISEGILMAATEYASNAQQILGGTTRTTGTVSALQRTFDQAISQDEVNLLLGN